MRGGARSAGFAKRAAAREAGLGEGELAVRALARGPRTLGRDLVVGGFDAGQHLVRGEEAPALERRRQPGDAPATSATSSFSVHGSTVPCARTSMRAAPGSAVTTATTGARSSVACASGVGRATTNAALAASEPISTAAGSSAFDPSVIGGWILRLDARGVIRRRRIMW